MKKYYVTTPIYYANDKPHIGHAYTTIAADVLARYHRLTGDDTWFLTGTDEHGAKVAAAALEAGEEPKAYVDKQAALFKSAWKRLDISYDDFIQTTEPRHETGAQKFLKTLEEKKALYKDTYKGLYCTGCEKFITEKELVDGQCPDHKKKPELIEEENWFFRLADFLPKVKELIESGEVEILPEAKKNEALGLIEQGLDDFSVSRQKVKWGISLPFDEGQTTYVWIEALTNYLTALDYENNGQKFQEFWPADMQLMAKDILKFHAIYWPALLLAADLPLPKKIFAHGFFTINGEKMSKTVGNIIDSNDLVKKFGADGTRYLLLAQFPFGVDGDIKEDRFVEKYNAELANNLGNLVSRVIKMTYKFFDGKVPKIKKAVEELPLQNSQFIEFDEPYLWQQFNQNFEEKFKPFECLNSIWRFVNSLNTYVDKNEPWKLAKEGKDEELAEVIYDLLYSLHQLSFALYPFIPDTAVKIKKALTGKDFTTLKERETDLVAGQEIEDVGQLFPRIE
ncbi:methionine--tRNA ligase [Patescibacteria group bacterium]